MTDNNTVDKSVINKSMLIDAAICSGMIYDSKYNSLFFGGLCGKQLKAVNITKAKKMNEVDFRNQAKQIQEYYNVVAKDKYGYQPFNLKKFNNPNYKGDVFEDRNIFELALPFLQTEETHDLFEKYMKETMGKVRRTLDDNYWDVNLIAEVSDRFANNLDQMVALDGDVMAN